jgi:hypothetical protein
MKILEPTLRDRAEQLYRRLLLLQRLFRTASADDDADWIDAGDKGRNVALCAAIRDVLDELAEHARILTLIPLPLNEWRPGDGSQDERWRALTELERREVLSIASGYENLITWSEQMVRGANLTDPCAGEGQDQNPAQETREATEYLKAERARLDRFRGEMSFLERRRHADSASTRSERSIEEAMIPADPQKPAEQKRVHFGGRDRRPLRP